MGGWLEQLILSQVPGGKSLDMILNPLGPEYAQWRTVEEGELELAAVHRWPKFRAEASPVTINSHYILNCDSVSI